MKRRIAKTLVFLLLGAILNVAAAWGCAQFCTDSNTLGSAWALALLTSEWRADGSPLRYKAFKRESFGCTLCGQPGANSVRQMRVTNSVGVPCRSFESWSQWDGEIRIESNPHILLAETSGALWLHYAHELPLMPILPGFAIDTIFYAVTLWVPIAALGTLRRRRRIKRGLCPNCAYDLRGSTSQTCPECGKAMKQ